MDEFSKIFTNGTPLRRVVSGRVQIDPETGERTFVPETARCDSTDGESLDTIELVTERFAGCGCDPSRKPGGRCRLCSKLSCETHHRCCYRCGMPLCGECQRRRILDGHDAYVTLCPQHAEAHDRRKRIEAVLGAVLKPFIRNDQH